MHYYNHEFPINTTILFSLRLIGDMIEISLVDPGASGQVFLALSNFSIFFLPSFAQHIISQIMLIESFLVLK